MESLAEKSGKQEDKQEEEQPLKKKQKVESTNPDDSVFVAYVTKDENDWKRREGPSTEILGVFATKDLADAEITSKKLDLLFEWVGVTGHDNDDKTAIIDEKELKELVSKYSKNSMECDAKSLDDPAKLEKIFELFNTRSFEYVPYMYDFKVKKLNVIRK
jgi:hypothetical protein